MSVQLPQVVFQMLRRRSPRRFGTREEPVVQSVPSSPPAPRHDTHDNTHTHALNVPGRLGIRAGRVHYTPPQGLGKYPTLTPGDGVTVTVDDQPILGQTVIFPESRVEISCKDETPELNVTVHVSEDHREASVSIDAAGGFRTVLEEQEAVPDLVVQAERLAVPPPRLERSALLEALDAAGVVHGFDETAIQSALKSDAEFPLVVAVCTPAVTARGESLERYYASGRETPTETTDPYSVSLETVEPGQVIARVVESELGVPGHTVLGAPIDPGLPEERTFLPGDGVVRRGNVFVATRAGRPVDLDDVVSVMEIKVIRGDLRSVAGRVTYHGDVLIEGDALEKTEIEADGNVVVRGAVSGARIFAGGDVVVHQSIVQSEVHAGGIGAVYSRIIPLLDQLLGVLALTVRRGVVNGKVTARIGGRDAQELLSGPATGRLIRHINLLKEQIETDKERQLLAELLLVIAGLEDAVRDAKNAGIIDVSRYLERFQAITALQQRYRAAAAHRADLITPSMSNARVLATGDVLVTESGCYQTRIVAGGDVRLSGRRATLRGAHVTAGGNVYAEEMGSYLGASTHIEVPGEGEIRSRFVHPGTTLKIGNQSQRFEKSARIVHARLDAHGALTLGE